MARQWLSKLRKAWPHVLVLPFIAVIVMCVLWWKEWQTLVSVGAILLAAYIAWDQAMRQLRGEMHNARVDRHSGLIMRLSERWESPWLRRGRAAIWEINKKSENLAQKIEESERDNVNKFFQLTAVGDFFEDIGFLVRNKYLEPLDLIEDIWKQAIMHYYSCYRQYIQQHAKEEVYNNFKWLADEMSKPFTSPVLVGPL